MKLWGGRFKKAEDQDMTVFDNSLPQGRLMYKEDIDGSIAHAKMLQKQKIIQENEASLIIDGLNKIKNQIESGTIEIPDNGYEDIHSFIETILTKQIGTAGKKLHTARSRNDQTAVDSKLFFKRHLQNILAAIDKLIQVFKDKEKEDDGSTIIPGYTHLQKAQAITFKYYLDAYVQMIKRDKKRILNALNIMDENPLGSGALAGTTHPIDRQFTTKLLGFQKPVDNFLDGVSDRDYVLEILADFSIMAIHLSRLSEELVIFSSQEFHYFIIDDSLATGSSMMPQKKNADSAELIRGNAAMIIGQLDQCLVMMKGLPLAYNKDMQIDKEIYLPAFKKINMMLVIMAKIIKSLKLDKKRLARSIKQGFLNATDMADYLVKKGVPFRDAHQIVGKAVLSAETKHKSLEQLSLNELKDLSPMITEDIYDYLKIPEAMKKGIKKEML